MLIAKNNTENNQWEGAKKFLSFYPASTQTTYRSNLKLYLSHFYPQFRKIKPSKTEDMETLDRISIKYLSAQRDYEQDLLDYKKSISHNAPRTRASKLSSVLSWFENNEINVSAKKKSLILGKNRDTISKEYIPKPEDIKKLLEHQEIGDRTMTLVLSSSGMRQGEATKITLDMMDLDHDPPMIKLPARITKTRKKRIVFINQEAKEALLEWLDYRKQYTLKARARDKRYSKGKSDYVFPFSKTNFAQKWAIAVEKAGFGERDENTNRLLLRPHNLRKYFRTHGRWNNPDVAEALMGHQAGLNAIYARLDQAIEILIQGYKEAEPHLSIYSRSKVMLDLKDRVELQESEIEKQRKEMDELIRLTTLKNLRLEEQVAQLNEQMLG